MTVDAPPAAVEPATDRAGAAGRLDAAWWLLPPLVLAVLGGWLVARHYGFWYDELFTAEMARLSGGQLAEAVVRGEGTIEYLRDAPPSYNAPYYAVVRLWLALTPFGPDEVGLRLLSLVASVAAAAVFTRAVTRLAGRRTGLIAGLVLAANPFVVAYAGEARGYALALLATAVTALGLARWLDGERGGLAVYGAAAAAGLAHWFALLVPAAFAVAALLIRRRSALPLVGATVLAMVPALGLLAIVVANGVGGSGAEWIRDAGLGVPLKVLRSWTGGHAALLVAMAVAVVAGAASARRADGTARVVGLCWAVLPVVAVTAAQVIRPVYVDRYLLPAAMGLAVLAALGLARVPDRLLPLAVAGLLVPSAVATVSNLGQGPREDVRGAVALVAADHRPGEPVVAAARWDALGVDHYTRRHHPQLSPDVVLPSSPVPDAPAVWVVRRATGGVKGDGVRLGDLDRDLGERGLRVVVEHRAEGRRSVVLVQRWETPAGASG
ncbi:MAG: glycosyltransferase family 39 protein [Actinomycetota bacterium]|nr:glycosyltransferase family 39 protein [Actinomycetota bacterium]